ncbi:carboxypeptidase-like regulatory domain-containing protein [Zunongwangia profunda]|uniref:carboxypeptidase-like regulatory domain-containing protein n=1 Tax=Zunongwangia profunda TaxID=398743 RepID=UPI001D17D9E5|nr:carboxypeptidase-like regulatory domain-containing protein [Zunongwangia profunda]MCC4226619.1 carboxypeptidase-like regulatory domain-containing protein [Zunongwangia profunda]|tara:strand:- start:99 stop:803 length:705 start_codon:yes stop_codon:yes gene_type:complete
MKISIEIPEACGENWEHMTVSQLGKFCQVCKKEVIDFTNTTDAELLQKIKSGQKICGRFKQSQLSRDLKPNNSKTNWKQLAVAAGFTSVLAIAAPANAQKTSTKTEQLEKTSEKNSEEKHSISAKDSIVISGTVTDEEDLPIPGVHIKVLDSKILTQTDFDGNFMIVLAAKTTANNLKLEFTSLGYETQVINADLKSENLDIKMNTSETITTGIVVVEKTNLLRRVGYFFKRLF